MVASALRRKRQKRTSTRDYKGADPPPFAPAQLALFKSYNGPLPRSQATGLSPPVLNLVLMAANRLYARDFRGAASVLPTLLKRYRQYGGHRWFFSREVAVTGAEVLRRCLQPGRAALLDDFLATIARDGYLTVHSSHEGYSGRAREAALMEMAMEHIAVGKLNQAYECLREQIQDKSARTSALMQGLLGMVAVAASTRDQDPTVKLQVATRALEAASKIEPSAYFFVYYSAAAAIAAGNVDQALELLCTFVQNGHQRDPIALFGVLACLNGLNSKNSESIRSERVDIARQLLDVDPLCNAALDVLREAHTWSWNVVPNVSRAELAEVVAGRIEQGDSSDVNNWLALGRVLYMAEPSCHVLFWTESGRCEWWPSHFFREARLNIDIATNPALASLKAGVAQIVYHPRTSPYADGLTSSGAANVFDFNVFVSSESTGVTI